MFEPLKSLLPARFRAKGPVIPVVRLAGAIGMGTPFRPGLSLPAVSAALERAFSIKRAPAVALSINSPGGSPVQSHLIYKRIRQLAVEKNKTVIAYVEDVAASGGYMIACAADEIVADPSSIVGSIGVVSASFGLDRFIERYGIERRVYTSGTRKVTLDPFQPENLEDVEHLKALQRDVHQMFIDLVTERRGASLSVSEDLFSGLFWAGEAGRALGLVDRTGDIRADLKTRFGEHATPRLVAADRGLFRRRPTGIAGGLSLAGASLAGPALSVDEALTAIEIRALWARYGL
ncbi:S49 family peptidase [Mongoliimonas terrestris]|uniref:S49 family peptidase n=1 Tax=Mongoliimonas terrestris TaxID=1709001 RepID=UPI000A61C310|nr:S49 family peptidase [Mongoliimonas terrestris]